MRGFPFFPFFCQKKRFENRLFQTRKRGETRRSILTYIYIIYNIKRRERRKHPKGDNYTHRFVLIFFI
jgi:hypothetical protein